jgi:tetratricopeptide (TPR) repeat protein
MAPPVKAAPESCPKDLGHHVVLKVKFVIVLSIRAAWSSNIAATATFCARHRVEAPRGAEGNRRPRGDETPRLAVLLQRQGDLAAARPLFERALAIYEKVLGPEPSLYNLAAVLRAQGDLAEARSLYERALAILEKVRGPEHRDTARVRNNLALLVAGEASRQH